MRTEEEQSTPQFYFPMIRSSSKMLPLLPALDRRESAWLPLNPYEENSSNEEERKLWKHLHWKILHQAWSQSYVPPLKEKKERAWYKEKTFKHTHLLTEGMISLNERIWEIVFNYLPVSSILNLALCSQYSHSLVLAYYYSIYIQNHQTFPPYTIYNVAQLSQYCQLPTTVQTLHSQFLYSLKYGLVSHLERIRKDLHGIFRPMIRRINELYKLADYKRISNEEYMKVILDKFLETPIGFNSTNTKPILIAISHGYPAILRSLLTMDCKLTPEDLHYTTQLNGLELAINEGKTDIIIEVLGYIHKNNNLNITQFDEAGMLLTIGIRSLNVDTFNTLFKKYAKDHITSEVFKRSLNHGIYLAIKEHKEKYLFILLKALTDINALIHEDKNVLMLICKLGTEQLLSKFISLAKQNKQKLDFNFQNSKRKTALLYASKHLRNGGIGILIKEGSKGSMEDHKGRCGLYNAIVSHNVDGIPPLLNSSTLHNFHKVTYYGLNIRYVTQIYLESELNIKSSILNKIEQLDEDEYVRKHSANRGSDEGSKQMNTQLLKLQRKLLLVPGGSLSKSKSRESLNSGLVPGGMKSSRVHKYYEYNYDITKFKEKVSRRSSVSTWSAEYTSITPNPKSQEIEITSILPNTLYTKYFIHRYKISNKPEEEHVTFDLNQLRSIDSSHRIFVLKWNMLKYIKEKQTFLKLNLQRINKRKKIKKKNMFMFEMDNYTLPFNNKIKFIDNSELSGILKWNNIDTNLDSFEQLESERSNKNSLNSNRKKKKSSSEDPEILGLQQIIKYTEKLETIRKIFTNIRELIIKRSKRYHFMRMFQNLKIGLKSLEKIIDLCKLEPSLSYWVSPFINEKLGSIIEENSTGNYDNMLESEEEEEKSGGEDCPPKSNKYSNIEARYLDFLKNNTGNATKTIDEFWAERPKKASKSKQGSPMRRTSPKQTSSPSNNSQTLQRGWSGAVAMVSPNWGNGNKIQVQQRNSMSCLEIPRPAKKAVRRSPGILANPKKGKNPKISKSSTSFSPSHSNIYPIEEEDNTQDNIEKGNQEYNRDKMKVEKKGKIPIRRSLKIRPILVNKEIEDEVPSPIEWQGEWDKIENNENNKNENNENEDENNEKGIFRVRRQHTMPCKELEGLTPSPIPEREKYIEKEVEITPNRILTLSLPLSTITESKREIKHKMGNLEDNIYMERKNSESESSQSEEYKNIEEIEIISDRKHISVVNNYFLDEQLKPEGFKVGNLEQIDKEIDKERDKDRDKGGEWALTHPEPRDCISYGDLDSEDQSTYLQSIVDKIPLIYRYRTQSPKSGNIMSDLPIPTVQPELNFTGEGRYRYTKRKHPQRKIPGELDENLVSNLLKQLCSPHQQLPSNLSVKPPTPNQNKMRSSEVKPPGRHMLSQTLRDQNYLKNILYHKACKAQKCNFTPQNTKLNEDLKCIKSVELGDVVPNEQNRSLNPGLCSEKRENVEDIDDRDIGVDKKVIGERRPATIEGIMNIHITERARSNTMSQQLYNKIEDTPLTYSDEKTRELRSGSSGEGVGTSNLIDYLSISKDLGENYNGKEDVKPKPKPRRILSKMKGKEICMENIRGDKGEDENRVNRVIGIDEKKEDMKQMYKSQESMDSKLGDSCMMTHNSILIPGITLAGNILEERIEQLKTKQRISQGPIPIGHIGEMGTTSGDCCQGSEERTQNPPHLLPLTRFRFPFSPRRFIVGGRHKRDIPSRHIPAQHIRGKCKGVRGGNINSNINNIKTEYRQKISRPHGLAHYAFPQAFHPSEACPNTRGLPSNIASPKSTPGRSIHSLNISSPSIKHRELKFRVEENPTTQCSRVMEPHRGTPNSGPINIHCEEQKYNFRPHHTHTQSTSKLLDTQRLYKAETGEKRSAFILNTTYSQFTSKSPKSHELYNSISSENLGKSFMNIPIEEMQGGIIREAGSPTLTKSVSNVNTIYKGSKRTTPSITKFSPSVGSPVYNRMVYNKSTGSLCSPSGRGRHGYRKRESNLASPNTLNSSLLSATPGEGGPVSTRTHILRSHINTNIMGRYNNINRYTHRRLLKIK